MYEFYEGIQTLFVGSKCHDIVIADANGTMISGHYDKKIRIWDPFSNQCRSELPFDSVITSLSYNNGRESMKKNRSSNIHFRKTTTTRLSPK